MQLITVKIEKPDDTNFILGQTHFIKSTRTSTRRWSGPCRASSSGWPSARRPDGSLVVTVGTPVEGREKRRVKLIEEKK